MLKSEIKVGGLYTARISSHFVTVRVEEIIEIERNRTYKRPATTHYRVTNLRTNKVCVFKSAAKFRSEVPARGTKGYDALKPKSVTDPFALRTDSESPTVEVVFERKTNMDTPVQGVEQRSDPMKAALTSTTPLPVSPPVAPATSLLAKAIAHVPAQTGHKPTDEQQAILDAVDGLGEGKVLVINAGAGAGKTSTLKMLEQVLPGIGQYTAFNSSLVDESKAKFKKAACNTTHSLAFRAIGKRFSHRLGGNRVRAYEVARILGMSHIELVVGTDERGEPKKKVLDAGLLASFVIRAIKTFIQTADREIGVEHFKYIDGIDQPLGFADGKTRRTHNNNNLVKAKLLPYARKAWLDMSDPTGVLPFTHDHYVKIWQLDKPVIAADYILLDEGQDTAPVMLDIVRQQTSSLIVVVGDDCQSIYGWRGAVNALESFPGAVRKLLTQSFRFGPAIADVANAVLQSMEKPTDLRLKGLPSIDSKVEPVAAPRCVLTRTNAAAVACVLNAIGAGLKVHMVGGGNETVRFVEAALDLQNGRTTSHPELACFTSWTEVQQYVKMDEGEDLKLQVKLIDEFGAAVILAGLKNMPKEDAADLVVSTAHKSKGREWDSVQLAQDFPTNGKSGDEDRRLLYVAVTRAKLVLDITKCPFFTGKDALAVFKQVQSQVKAGTISDSVAATRLAFSAMEQKTLFDTAKPVVPVPIQKTQKGLPTGFTWVKSRDNDGTWLLRGAKGCDGAVEVVRRDGTKSVEKLGKCIWENGTVALYRSERTG